MPVLELASFFSSIATGNWIPRMEVSQRIWRQRWRLGRAMPWGWFVPVRPDSSFYWSYYGCRQVLVDRPDDHHCLWKRRKRHQQQSCNMRHCHCRPTCSRVRSMTDPSIPPLVSLIDSPHSATTPCMELAAVPKCRDSSMPLLQRNCWDPIVEGKGHSPRQTNWPKLVGLFRSWDMLVIPLLTADPSVKLV